MPAIELQDRFVACTSAAPVAGGAVKAKDNVSLPDVGILGCSYTPEHRRSNDLMGL